ncbi:MAG: hypothetical protein K9L60_13670 [Methylovulum sp.]|nr:hypothetical protein [Methylovulum sp.]
MNTKFLIFSFIISIGCYFLYIVDFKKTNVFFEKASNSSETTYNEMHDKKIPKIYQKNIINVEDVNLVALENSSKILFKSSSLNKTNSLKEYLLSNNISHKNKISLLQNLVKSNNYKNAKTLLDIASDLIANKSNVNLKNILINELAKFNSVKSSEVFLHYLINQKNIDANLSHALISSIDNTNDKKTLSENITRLFYDSTSEIMREKIIEVSPPETLARIYDQASTDGDIGLNNKILSQFEISPSKYALDNLLNLSLLNKNQNIAAVDAAYRLASNQLSGERLDYIENNLSQNNYSEDKKYLLLDILSHSEDMNRALKIIERFSSI